MSTSVRLKPSIEERYTNLAKKTGRPKSYYFRQALESQIEKLEYEYDILRQVELYRAGKLETYTLEEVAKELGMDI